MTAPHLPILRAGEPYRSLDTVTLRDIRDGQTVATVSLANRGLISKDLLSKADHRRKLQEIPVSELISMCRRAAELFAEGELPVDPIDGITQTPEQYVQQLSATTGMPEILARGNMAKIRFVLEEMETVLAGLTRNLDLGVLDSGWLQQDGQFVSYQGQADVLGAVLPSNSPGVHSLWIPSVALKVPVALKPGSQEPWTPLRIGQALITAGMPPAAFSFYPTDYAGAAEILLKCDRGMMFGDAKTVGGWKDDPRIELHGPGWSKVLLGDDFADRFSDYIDLMVASVSDNGGRSCINASGVWSPRHGRAIAEALAERLAAIEARPLDDPDARLAAFPDPEVARGVSAYIDDHLASGGAEDLTANYRPSRASGRVACAAGCTFLLPTVVWCDDPSHPLASSEFLFPFVSVVEAPQESVLEAMGPSLVVSAVTEDPAFIRELLRSTNVERLNVGAFPTTKVSWDQPHEGNLFDHLYRRRAFQTAV
jgi:acyl-CoA reductase-like NAD-dependent aldehyde dehydrogenase